MKYNPEQEQDRKKLANLLIQKLQSCGFSHYNKNCHSNEEVIFSRVVDNTDRTILVYTSVEYGSKMVRKVDSDAIRVAGIDSNKKGVIKNRRVYRTGEMEEIVERMYNLMRESYGVALKSYSIKCNRCGANTFLSKSGNYVCSDLCWTNKGK